MSRRDWMKDSWHVYINQDMKDKVEDNIDILEEHFEGPGELVKEKLEEINDQYASLEQRIERKREELEEERRELQEMEDRLDQKTRKQQRRRKLEELKQLKSDYEQYKEQGVKTEEEIREELIEKRKARGHDVEDPEVQKFIERSVEKKLERRPNLDELRDRIDELSEDLGLETDFDLSEIDEEEVVLVET